jgi:microsomal dipeptidase-like Zn-dependent dipeptidase
MRIIPPRDLPTCLELPRIVEILLRRGLKPDSVQKILGGNFLRALAQLRGSQAVRQTATTVMSSSTR